MIFKRAVAKLRVQDWTAIFIELVIVIVGVYLGAVAANWNAEQSSRASTLRLLQQFRPELATQALQGRRITAYLDTSRAYAKVALAGWAGDPRVSDHDFVIAAYQASQITGSSTNPQVWAEIFGAGQVQNIRDPALRTALIRVLSTDSSLLDWRQLADPYRDNVRRVIPDSVQDRIRAACGDRLANDDVLIQSLPPTCDIDFAADDVKATAAALRAHSDLVGDLNRHEAGLAALLFQQSLYGSSLKRLRGAIDRSAAKE